MNDTAVGAMGVMASTVTAIPFFRRDLDEIGTAVNSVKGVGRYLEARKKAPDGARDLAPAISERGGGR